MFSEDIHCTLGKNWETACGRQMTRRYRILSNDLSFDR